MESVIQNIEKTDGIRMTWNIIPVEKYSHTKSNIPLAFLYSPSLEVPQIETDPIFCQNLNCRSILSPYNNIENNSWTCFFCKRRNFIKSEIKDFGSLPSTVEYISKQLSTNVVYFILLDICYFDDERQKLGVDAVINTLKGLPEECIVGFITFGTNVELYDLSNQEIRKTYLFSGRKEYETIKNKTFTKCFSRKNEAIELIHQLISKKDPFPVLKGYRQIRCTGAALSLAHAISTEHPIVKYMIFTQGPCTMGPGTIASLSLSDNIRSYDDILRGKSIYSKNAADFYSKLAKKIAENGHSVDILATTLYDVGIYEMRSLTDLTGGMIVMAQDFNYEIYNSSCIKNRNTGFNAKLNTREYLRIK